MAVPLRASMSWGEWIASITGIVIAIGTVILVVYTPVGPAVRERTVAIAAVVRVRLVQAAQLGAFWRRSHPTFVAVTLILIAVWSLAVPSLIGIVPARHIWSWTAGAVAALASALALVLAYRSQSSIPLVGPPIAPKPTGTESAALQAASRRVDLLRQAYALAAAMLKYVPDSPGLVPWNGVQQFNGLIYRLLGEGVDLNAFEISYTWTFEVEGGTDRYVEGSRVARQLEGLITYARAAGVGPAAMVPDQTG